MRIFPTQYSFSPAVQRWVNPDGLDAEVPTPIRLRSDEKLAIIRRLDPHRNWESLDDRRVCGRCGTTLSGRQLDVVGGTRRLGPLRLLCPSEGCISTPRDWACPGEKSNPAAEASDRSTGKGGHSVVRVVRKRASRAKALAAARLPVKCSEAPHEGVVKKIAKLLKPVRARA